MITGASSGIGEAVARRLAGRGWRCVLLARREERLRPLAESLGGEYEVCDVGDRARVEAVAARIGERHPRIHMLVNNAGIPSRGDFLTTTPEDIEQVLRVNYLGGVWCLRALLPALEAGAPAHVVNVVSVAGSVALARSGPYAASKHAQLAFSRALAAQLPARGIRVHTINPGFVETEGFPQAALRRQPLVGRLVARPELVARRLVAAVEHDRSEVVVPAWYRVASVVQALVPGPLGRIAGRTAARGGNGKLP